MLSEGAPMNEMKQYADRRGFHTMEQDAFLKARQGVIAPEEVIHLGLGLSMPLDDLEEDAPDTSPRRHPPHPGGGTGAERGLPRTIPATGTNGMTAPGRRQVT
jgi:hypothetical protein